MHLSREYRSQNQSCQDECMYKKSGVLDIELYSAQKNNVENTAQKIGKLEKKINSSHKDLKVDVEFSENRVKEVEGYRVTPKINESSLGNDILGKELTGYEYPMAPQPYIPSTPINKGYIGFYNFKKRFRSYH